MTLVHVTAFALKRGRARYNRELIFRVIVGVIIVVEIVAVAIVAEIVKVV